MILRGIGLAVLVLALTGLHDVRHQRLDLDDFALLGFLRKLEPRLLRHDRLLIPLLTGSAAAAADRDLHLLLVGEELAVAGLGDDDDVLRRREADARRGLAFPDSGENWKVGDARIRIAVGHHQNVADVIVAVIGASTVTDSGTVLPFSAISGSSIVILPLSAVLPPVNLAICSAASLAAAEALRAPADHESAAPRRRAPVHRDGIVAASSSLLRIIVWAAEPFPARSGP